VRRYPAEADLARARARRQLREPAPRRRQRPPFVLALQPVEDEEVHVVEPQPPDARVDLPPRRRRPVVDLVDHAHLVAPPPARPPARPAAPRRRPPTPLSSPGAGPMPLGPRPSALRSVPSHSRNGSVPPATAPHPSAVARNPAPPSARRGKNRGSTPDAPTAG